MKISFINKVLNILNQSEKYKILGVFILGLTTSILEMLGVFSIIPFITLITDPGALLENKYTSIIIDAYALTLYETRMFFGITIIIIFVLSNILNIFTLWLTINVIADFQSRISSTVLSKYLYQPYKYFIENDHAYISKNILDESCILADGIIYALLQILTKMLIILGLSILMIIVNYQLFFMSIFLFGIIYILIFKRYRNILFNIGINRVKANEQRYKNTREVLNNIKDVKYYSNERYYISGFSDSAYSFAHLNAKRNLIGILPRYFIEIFTFGGVFALILYFLSVSDNFLEYIPTISMFLFAIYRIMPQLQNIFTNTTNIKSSEYVFKNIESILNMDMISRKNTTPIENFNKSISFQNVTFSYDGNSNILENIDLDIKKANRMR